MIETLDQTWQKAESEPRPLTGAMRTEASPRQSRRLKGR
jgi:hypothetical protein